MTGGYRSRPRTLDALNLVTQRRNAPVTLTAKKDAENVGEGSHVQGVED